MIALRRALIPKSKMARRMHKNSSSKNVISPSTLRPPMNQGAISLIGCICRMVNTMDRFYAFVASSETPLRDAEGLC